MYEWLGNLIEPEVLRTRDQYNFPRGSEPYLKTALLYVNSKANPQDTNNEHNQSGKLECMLESAA